jgi:hypothetical protein
MQYINLTSNWLTCPNGMAHEPAEQPLEIDIYPHGNACEEGFKHPFLEHSLPKERANTRYIIEPWQLMLLAKLERQDLVSFHKDGYISLD